MIRIKNYMSDNEIQFDVCDDMDTVIVTYLFRSRQAGTEVGKRLLFITLLRYAVLDCFGADSMIVEADVSGYEAKYMEQELEHMVTYSLRNQNLELRRPTVIYSTVEDTCYSTPIPLDSRNCYIGYSGGKDSKLCYELIKDRFEKVVKFKIDFDQEEFNSQFYEGIHIQDLEKYKEISARQVYEKHGRNYYQEEDLHCCFAAPYFSVRDMDPAYLVVGLQFDVSNYYVFNEKQELISEFDLMETYQSMKTFENLLGYYGLQGFHVIEPLASATSFVIYEILRQEHGEDGLRKMNSCWNPNKDGSACGVCLKCQRVSYIYNCLGLQLTDTEKHSLALLKQKKYPLDYVFGSITCKQLLEQYNPEELKDVLFIDEKVIDLDRGMYKEISEKYGLRIQENPLKVNKQFSSSTIKSLRRRMSG